MKKETEKLFKDYENACTAIAEAFLNKQFGEEGEPPVTVDDFRTWWIEIGSVLCYNEMHFYDFGDILTDLKENAPVGEINKYNEWALRCSHLNIEPKCNYRSWLHGAPHVTEEALTHLEALKAKLNEEINNINNGK